MTDDEETKDALVVVPDDQLSLAIGREGQDVRLAHRLTGWKIDIKSVSQMENEEASKTANYEYNEEVQDEEERPVDSDEIQEEIEEEVNQAYVSIKSCATYNFFILLGVICLILSFIGAVIVSEELSGGAVFAVFVILALNAGVYFCLAVISQKIHEMHIRLGNLYNRFIAKDAQE